ncbi:kelch-like protein 32 isoform X7 [Carcharodon carcharias]|uniref:kelch-like protein 32 isoform X7 n=1 Tax=Carcharodon carcharias TaxID=13397 RepID=UPI001B7DC0BD|nr:kelch-like protein 32 isoform X7 [Carcharodon carcharias]
MPSEMCLSIQEMLTGHRLCQSKSHKDAVLAALNQQRNDGILCDVILVAEEQKFHAHKAVLAACSDYFRAMFSLCMVESVAEEVSLHGVTSLGLKQALDFAYTGQILLEPGIVQDVLAAGSHLQLLELLKLCSHYLIQLAVRWLEHGCRYQYMDELLQYVRFGLMDVDTLHAVALSHPLVQASETAMAFVTESLEYHQSIYAQPIWQTIRTRPRFQSETLYIVGGKKREICKVRDLRYFNPVNQENVHIARVSNWSELCPMPVGRSHHCVAVMGDFLFVAGGEVEHATGRTCAVRTACRYDPRSNTWTEIAPMKNCREHFVLGALDEYLYAVGGRNELRQVLPTVERYCTKKNKWSFVQSFDRSLSCHAGCMADGLLWISGGVTNTAQYQNRLMVYDPSQVLDVSTEGKEEVFYGPTLPFASNGIAGCFLPAPYFTCPNLQTLQVPHHRIGAM